ncbi:unnamed protein product [Sphenostylis stenocarpa]|uniref:SAM-dependent methyltransferase Erg6/SMT-type domain-containing protein n=1 Tax=Sphenostylis stenocarpa TaxID=92480 RepID=A0AA86RY56_9FABA|nr:unnamed protein product [Sphenostylis stenocarpa]
MKRHEHFLALQLELKPGQKVLDIGCGIGGPLREIARFSSTSITGLNNNEYQLSRAKQLSGNTGLERTCHYVEPMQLKPLAMHHAYACYKEILRVLKPGGYFASYEWCMTEVFDPNNQEHQKIKEVIEFGDGLPDIRVTTKCLEALKQAGLILREKDLAIDSPVPWYFPLDTSHFSLSTFRLTSVGRFFTKSMVRVLEFVGLAPQGSVRVEGFLQKAAEGLVEGGKKEIFTPMYFLLARKPGSGDR